MAGSPAAGIDGVVKASGWAVSGAWPIWYLHLVRVFIDECGSEA
jgi:hypothetical protein